MSVESDGIDHGEERDEPQMTQISVEFPFKSVSAISLSPLCLMWPKIPLRPVRETAANLPGDSETLASKF